MRLMPLMPNQFGSLTQMINENHMRITMQNRDIQSHNAMRRLIPALSLCHASQQVAEMFGGNSMTQLASGCFWYL